MRVLVTGANSQLGMALAQCVQPGEGMEWHFHGRSELDITDEEGVMQFVRFLQPDVVINTAAYTAVDRAEDEVDAAFAVNRDGVANLAAAVAASGSHLVHLSTDYVYDNGQCHPYRETDAVRPGGAYARSKCAGEQEALLLSENVTLIRASWLYGAMRHNFLQTMIRLGQERKELPVVYDQVGSPTWTMDLARMLVQLTDALKDEARRPSLCGVFNYSNEGVASWYDFAVAIMRVTGLPCRILPIRSAEYPTPAKRPSYSVMDKSKIRSALGLRIPHWQESLEECWRGMEKR